MSTVHNVLVLQLRIAAAKNADHVRRLDLFILCDHRCFEYRLQIEVKHRLACIGDGEQICDAMARTGQQLIACAGFHVAVNIAW